jgi:hypothetical protein
MNLLDKIMARVEQLGGCWIWTGAASHGYGAIKVGYGRKAPMRPTHRVVYELMIGPIPTGLELDHLCRNRRCCNPTHLEPVTGAENRRRSPLVGKASRPEVIAALAAMRRSMNHCRNGHPYDDPNTGLRPDGSRRCRACSRMARQRYLDRMIDAAVPA